MSILTTQDDFFQQIMQSEQEDAISTGYAELDSKIGGFRKGKVYVLGGRPSMDTTTLTMQMILNVLNKGKKVVVFTLGMSAEQYARRIITVLSKRDDLIANRKGPNRFEAAKEWLRYKELVIDEKKYASAGVIHHSVVVKNADLVVVDYFQLMLTESREPALSGSGRVNELIHEIKKVAEENNLPILGIAEIDGKCENEDDRRPRLEDICENNNTAADVVMALYRAAEVLVLKNSDGMRGVVAIDGNLCNE